MAETKTQKAEQQQTGARPCPRNCSLCSMPQQIFCATRMLYDLTLSQQEMERTLSDIQERLRPTDDGVQLSIPFTEQE